MNTNFKQSGQWAEGQTPPLPPIKEGGGHYKYLLFIILCSLFIALTSPLSAQSTVRNAFKSALIPGWAELSMGDKTGYIFLSAEIAMWTTQFYFEKESDLKIRQSKQFAYNHANMTSYNVSQEVWDLMARYDRSGFETGGYLESLYQQALQKHPNDPQAQTKYIEENNILPDDISWDWGDRNTRGEYQIFRKHSLNYSDYAKVMGGTIIANHIISFLNAIRVGSKQKNVQIYTTFDSELTPFLNCNLRF